MEYLEKETKVEGTLLSEIKSLEEVSWKLNGQIYGERPATQEGADPTPSDKLTFARNSIVKITKRLMEISDRLDVIGK